MRSSYALLAVTFLACQSFSAGTPADEGNAASSDAQRNALFFSTTPEGEPALGNDKAASDLERVALAIQGARKPALAGDGRLARVALALARRLDPSSTDLDLGLLASLTRTQGLINVLPQVVWSSSEYLERSRALVIERAQPIITRYAPTHFGLAAEKRGALWVVVLILDHRPIELEPIPTTLASADAVRVRARLLDNFTDATLVVTQPDGKFETAAHNLQGSTLDHTLTLSEGRWGLEIIGRGAHGPSVIANMVIEVGAPRATTAAVASDKAISTVADFTRRLEALIAAERNRQGLPYLARDAALDGVAAAHSADMREHHFIGHVSPTTGGPSDRLARARVPAWAMRENIARGYTPEEVHAFLMSSPAHRASILSADTDRLGLGVVEQSERGRQAFYVTELFTRQPFEITADQVLTDMSASALTGRRAQGLPVLVKDERLSAGALAMARRFFAEPGLTQDVLLQTVMKETRRPRGAKTVTARLFVGALPAAIDLTEELLDPAARWIGVGIARGNHAQFGADALAIVVFIAK